MPLLFFPRHSPDRERHWEIRMSGLLFDAQREKYPDGGSSLDVELMQLSVIKDVRFQNHAGIPFIFGSGPYGNVNACEFRDIVLLDNARPALLREASDFRWRGGNMETHVLSADNTRPFVGGLAIEGPSRDKHNTYAGPGLIEDVHLEFSRIDVRGVDGLTFRGGYRYWSHVHLSDCRSLSYAANGLAPYSHTWRDGVELLRDVCEP
jgi:hypothetical protein